MSQLWCFVEDLSNPGVISLSPEESRHLAARRLREGENLTVFDGRGRTATARVASLAKRGTRVEVGPIDEVKMPDARHRLATAIPKGDRLSTMLQMWTQLGLEVWQPLICNDSVVRRFDAASARVERVLIESCKVARRPWKMRVLEPISLEDAVELHQGGETSLYFADAAGRRDAYGASAAWTFVGPEAGFSAIEFDVLRGAGAKPISFGSYNLRIETAAVAAVSAFNISQGLTS